MRQEKSTFSPATINDFVPKTTAFSTNPTGCPQKQWSYPHFTIVPLTTCHGIWHFLQQEMDESS
jgi:hypothetical protein